MQHMRVECRCVATLRGSPAGLLRPRVSLQRHRCQAANKLRPLLIDNYDSYTYNLYQIVAEVYGVAPLVLCNDAADIGTIQHLLDSEQVHHIILSPGPGSPHTPADIGVCMDVLQQCTSTPLLGVCLGHQALAAAAGAAVVAAPQPVHGRLSTLVHNGHALFRDCPSGPGSGMDVVRYHSLVVEACGLPDVLQPLAWTCGTHQPVNIQQQRGWLGDTQPDAFTSIAQRDDQQQQSNDVLDWNNQWQQQQQASLIMALAHKQRPHYGVQFHPESIATRYGIQLLMNFRDLAYQHSGVELPSQLHSSSLLSQLLPAGPPGRQMPPRPWPSQLARLGSSTGPTAAKQQQQQQLLLQDNAAAPSVQQQRQQQEQQWAVAAQLAPGSCIGEGSELQLSWLKLPSALSAVGGSQQLFSQLVGPGPDTFWLDSSCAPERARFSFMGGARLGGPLWHRITYKLPQPGTASSGSSGSSTCSFSGECGPHSSTPGVLSISRDTCSQQQQDHHHHQQQQQVQLSVWDYLQAQLASLQLQPACAAAAAEALPFNFWGGFVGYFGYELKAECGGSNAHATAGPDAAWLFADRLLAVDHQQGDIYLLALHEGPAATSQQHGGPAAATRAWLSDMAASVAAMAAALNPARSQVSGAAVVAAAAVGTPPLQEQLQAWPVGVAAGFPLNLEGLQQQQEVGRMPGQSHHHHQQQQQQQLSMHQPLDFRLRHNQDAYASNVAACKSALHAGESYELCLTTAFELHAPPQPWDYYTTLRRINPAPYSAWLSVGSSAPPASATAEQTAASSSSSGNSSSSGMRGITVCCSSPERFLQGGRGGLLEAKPIKGTAARHPNDPAADAAAAAALRGSEKERAENLMIVDLLRNDLGRVCVPGSVHVPGLIQLESYATVHQLVSTVRGLRREDASCVDAIRAAFPGGSMTGAPKIRSMDILDGLEGAARGVYSGALGYLSVNDTFDMNIVIRTAVFVEQDQEQQQQQWSMSVGAGGAVVVQSDTAAEFAEMQLKAQQLLKTAELAVQQGGQQHQQQGEVI